MISYRAFSQLTIDAVFLHSAASLLVQGGADPEKKNRFGETPFSIMEMGNAGKRICVLSNKNKLLPMAELEKLEAEGREDLNLSGYILDGYNPLVSRHANYGNSSLVYRINLPIEKSIFNSTHR